MRIGRITPARLITTRYCSGKGGQFYAGCCFSLSGDRDATLLSCSSPFVALFVRSSEQYFSPGCRHQPRRTNVKLEMRIPGETGQIQFSAPSLQNVAQPYVPGHSKNNHDGVNALKFVLTPKTFAAGSSSSQ